MRARRSLRRRGHSPAGTLVAAPAATAAEPTVPFISEFHYDNPARDAGEFVEVQVPAGTSTAGWSVVLYNGTSGAVYRHRRAAGGDRTGRRPARSRSSTTRSTASRTGHRTASPWSTTATRRRVPLLRGHLHGHGGPANGHDEHRRRRLRDRHRPGRQQPVQAAQPGHRHYDWQGAGARTRRVRVNPPLATSRPVEPCEVTPTPRDRPDPGHRRSAAVTGQAGRVRGVVVGDVPGLGGFYLQDATATGTRPPPTASSSRSPVAVGPGRHGRGRRRRRRELRPDPDRRRRDVASAQDGSAADLPAAAALDLPAADAAARAVRGHAGRRPSTR